MTHNKRLAFIEGLKAAKRLTIKAVGEFSGVPDLNYQWCTDAVLCALDSISARIRREREKLKERKNG